MNRYQAARDLEDARRVVRELGHAGKLATEVDMLRVKEATKRYEEATYETQRMDQKHPLRTMD